MYLVLISLCPVLRLCHSFIDCALPPSLLFHCYDPLVAVKGPKCTEAGGPLKVKEQRNSRSRLPVSVWPLTVDNLSLLSELLRSSVGLGELGIYSGGPVMWGVECHRCCCCKVASVVCNPIDSSPPGSPIPGILKARTLEWVAISFSNAWKWKVKVKLLTRVRLLATPWTAAHQAPPLMEFSRQES